MTDNNVTLTVNKEGIITKWTERLTDRRVPIKVSTKKAIPDSIRWAVWERDNFTCQCCGSRKNLSIDHIHPESKGGEATIENCQTLCRNCNSKKGAK